MQFYIVDDVIDDASGEIIAEAGTVVSGNQAERVDRFIDAHPDHFQACPRAYRGCTVIFRIYPQNPRVEWLQLDPWEIFEATELGQGVPGSEFTHGILRMPGDELDVYKLFAHSVAPF